VSGPFRALSVSEMRMPALNMHVSPKLPLRDSDAAKT
jgi:hypothetical protein